MNNGFWNPFLWLIAKTFGYNIWSITFEEMFYILLGGWGMFKVLKEAGAMKAVAIIIALSYMTNGYITGHLQHFCWISGTAFFPYVLLYFLKINKQPTLKNYVLGSLAVFFFLASTHPGLIIGAIYFFLFALVIIFLFRKNYCNSLYQPKFGLINLSFILLGCVFSIVVITSNLDVLQHISRGSKVNLAQSLLAPTSFQSYLSLLFPLAVNKSSLFATDISMRNVYIGLGGLAGIIFSFKYLNRKIGLAIMIPLLFFILLSSGGSFKTFFNHALPFLGYVRLNGEFTYFVIVILLLLAAFGLQHLFSEQNFKWLTRLTRILTIFFIAALLTALIIILTSHSSVIFSSTTSSDFKSRIKSIIDKLQFADLLFISAGIQLVTVLLIHKKYFYKKTLFIIASNLVIMTWLTLPFTGLGMSSKKEMRSKMNVLPHGTYAQELQPLRKTVFLDSTLFDELQLLGSYSKKIGYPKEEYYPVQLNTTKIFFGDTSLHHFINDQAFVFLSTDTTLNAGTNFDTANIQIQEFGNGHLKIVINNPGYNYINFLQNDYPYWQTFVNGKKVPHFTGYKTFITLPVEKGRQVIEFKFEPQPIKKALWINICIILAGVILLLIPGFRNRNFFN